MNKKIIILFLILAVILAAGFYFFKSSAGKEFTKFNIVDVGSIIKEAVREVSLPPPLKIEGPLSNSTAQITKVQIIAETNAQRQANGLPRLSENTALSQAALAKANDILKNQYFDHVSPLGVSPSELVQNYGYEYITTGENLILGMFSGAKEMVQKWMDSPGHRANILNNRYTEIGAAVVKGSYKGDTVWVGVQEFGLPMALCAEPDVALKNKIDLYKSQLESISSQIDQLRQQVNKENIAAYNLLVEQYNSAAKEVKNLISQYNAQVNTFNSCLSAK